MSEKNPHSRVFTHVSLIPEHAELPPVVAITERRVCDDVFLPHIVPLEPIEVHPETVVPDIAEPFHDVVVGAVASLWAAAKDGAKLSDSQYEGACAMADANPKDSEN